jgi:hypothetical protein
VVIIGFVEVQVFGNENGTSDGVVIRFRNAPESN